MKGSFIVVQQNERTLEVLHNEPFESYTDAREYAEELIGDSPCGTSVMVCRVREAHIIKRTVETHYALYPGEGTSW